MSEILFQPFFKKSYCNAKAKLGSVFSHLREITWQIFVPFLKGDNILKLSVLPKRCLLCRLGVFSPGRKFSFRVVPNLPVTKHFGKDFSAATESSPIIKRLVFLFRQEFIKLYEDAFNQGVSFLLFFFLIFEAAPLHQWIQVLTLSQKTFLTRSTRHFNIDSSLMKGFKPHLIFHSGLF